ncbi:hypothetical protein VM1G_10912 [Cytospora mali]|uniref:Uncharacterized protein n=1 Tax=Cytospora mali TaxID=578113 RepID=A0A194VJR9_CYTMA|nr:hypothetical protein VM1G_10912 [Valsa mali]
MNNRTSKTGPRRPRMRLSRSLQEQPLNAVARERAEYPPDQSIQSPSKASLPDVQVNSTKRQLDEIDQSAAKRTRLSTEVEAEGAQPADKTAFIQHPKPKPLYAAFLKRFVEPFQPRSGLVDSFVSEWLESVGSDRSTNCRSDSCLSQFVSEPVPRQGTKSASQIGYTRDSDGFMLPPTPILAEYLSGADIESVSVASDVNRFSSSLSQASGGDLVEDPLYRDMNLAVNNIYLRPLREPFPNQIAELINHMRRGRDSPGPSTEEVWEDAELNELWMGAGESKAKDYFRDRIFPKTQARLYISWKHDELQYYMANVESFLLHRPDHYLEFRKYVRNIIGWGKDKRLSEIRSSLDTLLKASRERASVAKSRPPPSDISVTSSKRDKSSSRGRAGDTESDFDEPSGAGM